VSIRSLTSDQISHVWEMQAGVSASGRLLRDDSDLRAPEPGTWINPKGNIQERNEDERELGNGWHNGPAVQMMTLNFGDHFTVLSSGGQKHNCIHLGESDVRVGRAWTLRGSFVFSVHRRYYVLPGWSLEPGAGQP
jgi:hypothetical protein